MGISQSNEEKSKSQRFDYINHNTGNIFNYYDLVKHIGIGRCGAVYHAKDIKTNLPRAIKEFRISKMKNEDIKNFECEVKIIKSMDHPNIMKIYEVIESPYAYYLVCEYLEGRNLMEEILRGHKFNEKDIARYMEDILYAISYCNQEKYMHNDIRPDNMVFEGPGVNGKLKLIDFGQACGEDENDERTKKYGQIHFRAPETFVKVPSEAQLFDLRAKKDVWSAGVIFYILLTKKPLVAGSKDKDIKKFHKAYNPSSLDELGIDQLALNLLKAMLEKDPTMRVSAQEALNFPFLKKHRHPDKAAITETIAKMQTFISTSALDTKMMSLVAVHLLTVEEEKSRSSVFKSLDLKFDGYLDQEELEEASNQFGFPLENARTIAINSDLDASGKISYTEYLTCSLNWKQFLNVEKIDTVLGHFDVFRKGALTENELKKLLKGVSEAEWNNFFEEVDQNNDRLISTTELQKYFLKIAEKFATVTQSQ